MAINILIPDGHSTWALSVINCLAKQSDMRLFVLSNKKRTATKFSKHTSYYRFYPKNDDTSWLKIINTEIIANKIDVVIPIAEIEIKFFIDYSQQVSKRAKVVHLPPKPSFDIAINKMKLGEFCFEHQIPYPQSVLFKDHESILTNGNSISYPVLLKPFNQKGGDGIVKFNSKKQIEDYINKNTHQDGYFIQNYIEGYDIDCSVCCIDGTILTHTIQKGYLPGHTPYAPHLGVEFLNNDEVLKVVEQLMKTLNWSGVAHIDLRYDHKANTYNVIEINARFWGSVEASKAAGVNFPLEAIRLALGQKIESVTYEPIKYERFKGVLKHISKHPSFIFNFNFLINNTETKSVLLDPLPTLYKFREWLGRQF